MVDAIESAQRFTKEQSRSSLESNEMLAFALVRAIEIIGEAAARVTQPGRDEFPHIPWNEIVGMRNRLVHAYFDVDFNILWTTATKALPPLLEQLKSAITMK